MPKCYDTNSYLFNIYVFHETVSFLKFGLPRWLSGKESTSNAGDVGSIPGLGRYPEEGNGNPLWYSCLGNPMDTGAWQAIVHGVTKELEESSTWQITFPGIFCK